MGIRWILAACLVTGWATAADRQVVITIDDLPRAGDGGRNTLTEVRGMTEKLLSPFRREKIPVAGFLVGQSGESLGTNGLREILNIWLDAGAELGNHSYSHLNINQITLEEYNADILRGDRVLRAMLKTRGTAPRYYRHPFLHTGQTPAAKSGMQRFLESHGYRVAPVTIDNSDYQYARLYTKSEYRDRVLREYVPYLESVVSYFEKRTLEVVGQEIPQILLLHASQLNADAMPDILAMFKRRGYRLVSLDQALADKAYRLPDEYVGTKGLSWIHRWSVAKGMPMEEEPEPPEWVQKAWAAR